MQKRFKIDFNTNNDEYYFNKRLVKVIICANLNSLNFDSEKFKQICAETQGSLLEVVLIQSFDRPETIVQNLNKISQEFTGNQLKEFLFIHFTSTTDEKRIEDIKQDVKNFNGLFNKIAIRNDNDKLQFIDDQIDILTKNTSLYNLFRKRIVLNFIRNKFFILLCVFVFLLKFGFRLFLKISNIIYYFICNITWVLKTILKQYKENCLAYSIIKIMDCYYIISSKVLKYKIFRIATRASLTLVLFLFYLYLFFNLILAFYYIFAYFYFILNIFILLVSINF